ncbi:hypothetical protein [Mucilaginibacter sp. RCC_168]
MPKTTKNRDCFLKHVKAHYRYIFLMFRKVIFDQAAAILAKAEKMAYF